jgi:Helix-hairpin-helix domain
VARERHPERASMINEEIATIFEQMSRVLAFKGADRFRVLAYDSAANSLRRSTGRPSRAYELFRRAFDYRGDGRASCATWLRVHRVDRSLAGCANRARA